MELEDLLNEFGLQDFQNSMDKLFPDSTLSFGEIWTNVIKGDFIDTLAGILELSMERQAGSLESLKRLFLWLVIMGLASALMTHFVEIFDRSQVADICYYFIYLMVSVVLLKCFAEISQIAAEALDNIVLFVKLLIPTYLVAVGVSSGTATVTVYYELVIVIIYGVEKILMGIVIPMISCYLMMSVINGIWPEERLELMAELIRKGVSWILKAGIGLITGLSFFQALISPAMDSLQSAALKKMVSAIPGIGGTAEGIMDITLVSAMAVKNSVGVVLLILLLGLCAAPLLKIGLVAGIVKFAAAVMGIVSDKRITSCTNHMADAGFMLFKTTGAAMVLFMISLSVVAISTNQLY